MRSRYISWPLMPCETKPGILKTWIFPSRLKTAAGPRQVNILIFADVKKQKCSLKGEVSPVNIIIFKVCSALSSKFDKNKNKKNNGVLLDFQHGI